ncbi:MAG: rhodanese-like domain-containing protein [Pseudomonadota bacterium]
MNNKDTSAPFGFRRDLHRWQQLVTPAWVAGLITEAATIAAPARDWRLLEIGFGVLESFLIDHIPGAGYLDTMQLENGPLWNKVSDRSLLQLLLRYGIRHDTTVVLYGRHSLAAARAAHLMLYAGVKDVRLLDGGYAAWRGLGFPVAQGMPRQYPAASDFGTDFPAHPEYLADIHQVRKLLRQADGSLVSIRTWSEFIGQTSGYSYIQAKGDIPGARWGRSGPGHDINSMSEFHDAGSTMKSAAENCHMWSANGIRPDQQTVFYCGTGWRASLAFFYSWLMNWQRIGVYDGGWCEWSRDPDNPVVCRVNASREDSCIT